jgi:hypothetical protein
MNGIFGHWQASDFIRAAGAARLKKKQQRLNFPWFARAVSAHRDCDIVGLCSR